MLKKAACFYKNRLLYICIDESYVKKAYGFAIPQSIFNYRSAFKLFSTAVGYRFKISLSSHSLVSSAISHPFTALTGILFPIYFIMTFIG